VHFSGGKSERLSSLRHEKRYKVPESPLLQVSCDCLMFDQGLTKNAQLVGGGLSIIIITV
jgi:hypothetical protein